jgi:hypothetical protein
MTGERKKSQASKKKKVLASGRSFIRPEERPDVDRSVLKERGK